MKFQEDDNPEILTKDRTSEVANTYISILPWDSMDPGFLDYLISLYDMGLLETVY